MDLPQNTGTQRQTVKIPISPIQAKCSGFCSGFKGDFTHVPDDVTKPDEKGGFS
jgi:hypothetical protein